jgi:Protein of unknown function (DUF1353)
MLEAIPAPVLKPFADNRQWALLLALTYRIGSSQFAITVPAGFVTDFASIPQLFWSTGLAPDGRYSKAALVHDYLYWTQLCRRSQADNIFLIAMKESAVAAFTRNLVYAAVRVAGGAAWAGNARAKAAGLPRIIPVAALDFGPQVLWAQYQLQLRAAGVKDPPPGAGSYCVVGDATRVPGAA